VIIVGAPVYERDWILREWFDALAHQEDFDPGRIEVVLNYAPGGDATRQQISYEQMLDRFYKVTVLEDPHTDHVGHRMWTLNRYVTMTRLRNDLLAYVRSQKPDFYLSCDTDMLLPPHTLRILFENLNGWNAIAPLTFMTTAGEQFPNCFGANGERRLPEHTSQMRAVFGTVLMDPAMYEQVDYAPHALGEDLGWAENAERAGLTMAICTDIRVKHAMNREMLDMLDVRVGF
jgi:hypothetical protein